MDLKNKTALVTGGIAGIGAAISRKLAQHGANVVMVDIRPETDAIPILEELHNLGINARFFQADVSDFKRAADIVAAILKEFGHIDILVNNAGINRDGVIWKMTEDQWDDVVNVNLKGYFNFTRAVSGYFREQQSGKIVNVASINGLRGKFGQSNYSASKAGIIGFTKAVAKELGKYHVTVNAVAPGLIETEMMKDAGDAVLSAALGEIALGKIGKPEDVANLVAFLCSDLAGHITGEVIKVDGGQYI